MLYQDKIFEHYSTRYTIDNLKCKIDNAVIDIKEYDKALSLSEEMVKFNEVGKNTRKKTFKQMWETNIQISPTGKWDRTSWLEMLSRNRWSDTVSEIHMRSDRYSLGYLPIKARIGDEIYLILSYAVTLKDTWGLYLARYIYTCDVDKLHLLNGDKNKYEILQVDSIKNPEEFKIDKNKYDDYCIQLLKDLDFEL